MGSTVMTRLKLQVEMSISLNGSKKKKRKRVTTCGIDKMPPFSSLSPAGK
jgi:hypothetical protein